MPFRECPQGKVAGGAFIGMGGTMRLPARALAVLCILIAAGCSEQDNRLDERLSVLSASAERQIGPQEKAAAASLAVYTADEPTELDPYARALDCASSVTATNKRLANSPLVGDAELAALAEAEKLFEARVIRLASDNGRSGTQASADLARARNQAAQDNGRAGRTAIACIRALGATPAQGAAPQG